MSHLKNKKVQLHNSQMASGTGVEIDVKGEREGRGKRVNNQEATLIMLAKGVCQSYTS